MVVGERGGAGWSLGLVGVIGVLSAGCPAPPAGTGTETGEEATSTTGVTSTGTTGDDVMTSTVASESGDSSSSGAPAPTCDDGVQNQSEGDVDCGGPCAACATGQACSGDADCASKACDAGTCVDPECLSDGDCPAQDGMCIASVCAAFRCEVAPAFEGEPCEDDDMCTMGTTCQAGACTAKETIDCTGLDSPCTQGQCDPGSGACLVADLADGTDCDDGDSCTESSTCKAGSCLPKGFGAVFFEDFSAPASGWELDGQWQIGVAIPSASGVGGADPAIDHSPGDDDKLAGTAVGGLDTMPKHTRWCLSSPAIDTSKLVGALWVSFWRHLHAPAMPAVTHSVEVWDGAIWNTLETGYGGLSNDADWTFVQFDASGFQAKGFRVRICVERTGVTPDFAGWSVDDLTVAALPCTPG